MTQQKQPEAGQGVKFERTRRITGYLSNLDRFNNAKSAEERDRLKHPGVTYDRHVSGQD